MGYIVDESVLSKLSRVCPLSRGPWTINLTLAWFNEKFDLHNSPELFGSDRRDVSTKKFNIATEGKLFRSNFVGTLV